VGRRIPWATYDVSQYFRLDEYERTLAAHGMTTKLLNGVRSADVEV
jgi:hypothetical protein